MSWGAVALPSRSSPSEGAVVVVVVVVVVVAAAAVVVAVFAVVVAVVAVGKGGRLLHVVGVGSEPQFQGTTCCPGGR